MPTWLVVAAMLVITAVAGFGYSMRVKKNDEDPANSRSDEEALARYSAKCIDGETVSVLCRACAKGPYYYVLTNKRLMIDTKNEQTSIDLRDIKKIKMEGFSGYGVSKTRHAADGVSVTVYTEGSGKHKLFKYSESFARLAEQLQSIAPSK